MTYSHRLASRGAVRASSRPTPSPSGAAAPVGQMAIRSAFLLGAEAVVGHRSPPRTAEMAKAGGRSPVDFEQESVVERLNELTNGKGPEKCIDCVGLEATSPSRCPIASMTRQADAMAESRPWSCPSRNDTCMPLPATVSIRASMAAWWTRSQWACDEQGPEVPHGQTHVNRWTDDLLRRIEEGQIDPSFVITHTAPLKQGPEMYKVFRDKQDSCVKVVLKP